LERVRFAAATADARTGREEEAAESTCRASRPRGSRREALATGAGIERMARRPTPGERDEMLGESESQREDKATGERMRQREPDSKHVTVDLWL